MIIVKLKGGIGNQMFQYAAGRRLAIKHKTFLKLDLTFLEDRSPQENFTYRTYELDVFNIQCNITSQTEINRFFLIGINIFNYFKRKLKIINVITESNLDSYEDLKSVPDNSYLDGYWQSENFFKDIKEIIRSDFTPKLETTAVNQELAKQISSCNSVSLHIRRGDYISNTHINKFHGVLKLEYYQKAVETIVDSIKNPQFFIFSDDPNWANGHLNLDFPITYITHNVAEKSFEDIRLMSLCKHNIIANSSFSWWGAWLNENPEKIIIAPERWFADVEKNKEAKDLIPEIWLRL